MAIERWVCSGCGEVIGVYEPAVLVLPTGSAIHGSPLILDHSQPGARLHATCYERAEGSTPLDERGDGA